MSDQFNIAARLPMTRAGFDRWLARATTPPRDAFDWKAMYRGWYWEGTMVLESPPAEAPTVGLSLASRLPSGESANALVVRHLDEALVLYDAVILGPDHERAQRTMSLMAQAAEDMKEGSTGHFAYWAEIGGALPGPNDLLALGEVSRGSGARFLTPRDFPDARALQRAIGTLKPAEALLFRLFDAALGAGSYPDLEVMRSADFIDPAIVALAAR